MTKKCVPMIHVTNVRATVEWYQSIGFTVVEAFDDGDDLSFAFLSFGSGEVMFNAGGRPSMEERREVDVYVYTEDVDTLYDQLKGRVDVVAPPHDTFYGMREVIVRDPDRFWVTFGEISAGVMLMAAVNRGDADGVRTALSQGHVSPERLSAALADASRPDRHNSEIVAVLEQAGAVAPLVVDAELLGSYTGVYKGEEGIEVRITLEDGTLRAIPNEGDAVRLLPVDQVTFKPVESADALVVFDSAAAETLTLKYTQGSRTMRFQRSAV